MQRTAAHQDRAQVSADAATPNASNSVASTQPRTPSRAADELFAGVSHAARLQLELVVRSASDQDIALVAVIALLVNEHQDSPKCAAIVAAFQSNPALQRQWQNAWSELRV